MVIFLNLNISLKDLNSVTYLNLTFWGPCIVIYSYYRSQHYALFLNFILIYNYTWFRQTYSPPSGVLILYSQQFVFGILIAISKLKYFGHTMHSSDSTKKGLMLGLTGGSGILRKTVYKMISGNMRNRDDELV